MLESAAVLECGKEQTWRREAALTERCTNEPNFGRPCHAEPGTRCALPSPCRASLRRFVYTPRSC